VTGSAAAPMLVPAGSLLFLGGGAVVVWIVLGLGRGRGADPVTAVQ
jgi:hypothetical protein